MSPAADDLLMEHIDPRLRAAIPRVVQPVGAEDHEELVQDAIVLAAQMLDAVERHGKKGTPGNIAYYTILHMKSGRRSQSASRADSMACGTQLDAKSCLSMEDEVGYDPELDEAVRLGDVLASQREDPSLAAARNIDWERFVETHDYRYGVVVKGFAEGKALFDIAAKCGVGYPGLHQLRQGLTQSLLAFMGHQVMEDSAPIPAWRAHLVTHAERAACRADRRRE